MHATPLTSYQWATVAVALLGGDTDYVDREEIAIKLGEIAPGRFAWKRYPDRIDLVSVVAALRDAKKPKNGGLLVGSNKGGWMVSSAGTSWLSDLDWQGLGPVNQAATVRRDSLEASQEAERVRLRTTRAYELYMAGEADAISRQDFQRFARVNEYFQTRTRQRRYAIVGSAVAGDDGLSVLWELLKNRFSEEAP